MNYIKPKRVEIRKASSRYIFDSVGEAANFIIKRENANATVFTVRNHLSKVMRQKKGCKTCYGWKITEWLAEDVL